MNEHPNVEMMRRFYAVHDAYYAGGSREELEAMMADDIAWHVPGRNAIAGTYRGLDEVFGYFDARRAHARGTFRIHVRDVLANDAHAVVLAGGTATIAGAEHGWETAGVFRLRDGLVAECWLLPFDAELFDRVWR